MAPGDGRIGIDKALELLTDGTVKGRAEGVDKLLQIFKFNSHPSALAALKDGAYHAIYEALFKVAYEEKSIFLSAKTAAMRTKSEKMLASCSDALRITIKAGAEKLRPKTLKAVIEHVTQLLPVASGEYCAGMSDFYLKVLGSLLSYEPHVEHLELEDWLTAVDFCLQGILQYKSASDNQVSLTSRRSATTVGTPTTKRQNDLGDTRRSTNHVKKSISKRNTEDLMECLSLLLSAPNAPIFERLEGILRGITHFLLEHGALVNRIHQTTFSALNVVLSTVKGDRIHLSLETAANVIPVISTLWSSKSAAKDEMLNSARHEMLITIILFAPYMERIMRDSDLKNSQFQESIRDLDRVLKADYSKRSDRDRLQLEDLDLVISSEGLESDRRLAVGLLHLRPHTSRLEKNWAILYILYILDEILHIDDVTTSQDGQNSVSENHSSTPSRKRRRITHRYEELLDCVASSDEGNRLLALQILLFALPQHQISQQHQSRLLEVLTGCITDKRSNIMSWAMLCIASCTLQLSAPQSFDWHHLWHTVLRLVTVPANCRAASYLLHTLLANDCVQYHNIAEEVDAVVTIPEINAPAILCDSSSGLMTHLLLMRNYRVPGGNAVACLQVIRWFSTKWNPSEKSFATQCAFDMHPIHVVNLLRSCLGMNSLVLSEDFDTPMGVIGQAWSEYQKDEEIIRYLLLLDKVSKHTTCCAQCSSSSQLFESVDVSDRSPNNSPARQLMIELILPKIAALLQEWERSDLNTSLQVSADTVRCAASTCIVGCMVLALVKDADMSQLRKLMDMIQTLTESLVVNIQKQDELQDLPDVLLQVLRPYIPKANPVALTNMSLQYPQLVELLSAAGDVMRGRQFSSYGQPTGSGEHEMDLDDIFGSPNNGQKPQGLGESIPRRDTASRLSSEAFHMTTSCLLILVSKFSQGSGETELLPSSFLNYLLGLSRKETLLSRSVFEIVFKGGFSVDIPEASRLIQFVGEILTPQFSSCEVALGLCLDVLIGLVPIWSVVDNGDLADRALDLYSWLINVVLRDRRPSPNVQTGIVDLLYALLRRNPEYGESRSLPSVRSCLFDLLQKGPLSLKFHMGERLPDLFSLFVLQRHNEVLADVLDSLPLDAEWSEGIAFRLYVLSKLASRWSTLLRSCVYYILEVSGKLPNSAKYAKKCITDVSQNLDLESPRLLFQIFASQLLFTWLEIESFENIPYEVFSYISLKSLLYENREEVVGLMIMRNQDTEVAKLADRLTSSMDELLQHSFTKVIAYSIANDISIPQPNNGQKYITGEARVRKRLGKDLFFQMVNSNFADIVATFFNITEQEESAERVFAKNPGLNHAVIIMQQIRSISASETTLPPGSQPAFKVKYLTSQVEHLCKRTEFEFDNLFKAPLVVFIARRLLNTLHPALGSMHACSVLRKLRVLIAISGDTAFEGYPVEMLLSSVRHFMTDPHCAQDAFGIIQYILDRGTPHLEKFPSYVAGVTLSILASLRRFLDSEKASTTQESQYRSSLTKAEALHSWIGTFLDTYQASIADEICQRSFRSIMQAAHGIRSTGNADIGTTESDFLIALLDDQQSPMKVLDPSSRKLAFNLFFSGFEGPKSFRTDILGADNQAVKYVSSLWEFCQDPSLKSPLLTWAGKIIGRAFAATGHISEAISRETNFRSIKAAADLDSSMTSSRTSIFRLLYLLTLNEDLQQAGLAEITLRVLVTQVHESGSSLNTTACEQGLSQSLLLASVWSPHHIPPSDLAVLKTPLQNNSYAPDAIGCSTWLVDLALCLAQSIPSDPVINSLQQVLQQAPSFAEQVFPFLLHLVLSSESDASKSTKHQLSTALKSWFVKDSVLCSEHLRIIINALLFLRTQPLPGEDSIADRIHWLDLDCNQVSDAAVRCGMFKTALLFTEIAASEAIKSSRRSSGLKSAEYIESLRSIYTNIDDPDMFYGLEQGADLNSISARLEYEKAGLKSLMFRGAQYDSILRQRLEPSGYDTQTLVNALSILSLDGLSHSLLQSQQKLGKDQISVESTFETARKLEQWDLPLFKEYKDNSAVIYKAFQSVNVAVDHASVIEPTQLGISSIMSSLIRSKSTIKSLHSSLQSLAVLTEMEEVLSSSSSVQFEEILERYSNRSSWMNIGRFEDVNYILSCRATLLSCLSQQTRLRDILNISLSDTRLIQVQTDLLSAKLNRAHGAFQETLKLATHLHGLVTPCLAVGLNIEAVGQLEVANALWDQDEMTSSIGVLQSLEKKPILQNQSIPISRSDLLAKIASQVSVARLETPDRIVDKYLVPALKELRGKAEGNEAGQVFHEFAVFCDRQLQDPDAIEDLERLRRLKEMKESEVRDLAKLTKAATTSELRSKYHGHWNKAKQWLHLDTEEFRRLSSARDELLRQSLENYLLSLAACDDFGNDALRLSALWLEHSDEDIANESVEKYLARVASWKFATLANQLTSRLLDTSTAFQQLLFGLVLRICKDHPYHGMYQIWAGSKSRSNSKDESARSRNSATSKVGQHLAGDTKSAVIWSAISNLSRVYCQFAAERDEARLKAGQKLALKNSPAGNTLNSMLPRYPIPPPTLQIEVLASRDYSSLPTMLKFESHMTIASGVSAPKIVTVIASDGTRHKQLVKGGTDDLRQDAIMEQVFAQVNVVLRGNTATRQRDLSIRTYKVLPLSSHAGIIEFVPDTIPLHEYLMPAHERYYPKDLKGSQCRKQISDVQTQKLDVRIRTYRNVTDRFHPVLRYFFLEKFHDPDDWFVRRVAYTRSTAAISMLGHVLGLGDRHGHNILLDEQTGEVVHIDLGVAFETGRVLPVPELVPFRLTRDIEDGMGISKTEGVFRRCCEYTLEAMRKEAYSIMTILDVLRYDPLYTWSISPVRLAKLQDAQSAAPPLNATSDATDGNGKPRGLLNEPGEADRALTVVRKKLSKTLSVTATVNDLINQATDYRNLAVLYAGWAAYA